MTRPDGRQVDQLRPITFQRDFTEMADGSCLVSFGRTQVLCTASIDEDVPRWMRGNGKGWVTAEYSMLPGSSPERVAREAAKGKQSGRTVEIQRLIGRSLRAACDMTVLGERQVVVDCDVLGPGVTLVSSADETGFAARDRLHELGLLRPGTGPGAHRFLSSGDIDVFRELGGRLLGPELEHTERWPGQTSGPR